MEAEDVGWFFVTELAGLMLYLWLLVKYQEIKYHRVFMCIDYPLTADFFILLLRQYMQNC